MLSLTNIKSPKLYLTKTYNMIHIIPDITNYIQLSTISDKQIIFEQIEVLQEQYEKENKFLFFNNKSFMT